MALERVLIRPVADVRELDPTGADIAELSAIDYAAAIVIGGTSATSVDIGRIGQLTTIKGNLQVDGTTTLVNTMTAQGDVNLGDGADTINIGGGLGTDTINLRDNLNVAVGILIDLKTAGGYISLPTDTQAAAVDGTSGFLRINTTLVPDTLEWLDLDIGAWMNVAFLGGGTLDFAYDGGGAGAGREITCDSGAVKITGSNAADYSLEVTNSAAGGALFVNSTGTGNVVDFQDGGGNVFQIADGGAFDLDASTFDLNATGNITLDTSGGVIDIDATGAIDIDSSAGAIGIGTTPVAVPINIGTGAAARKVTIGELTTVTEVQIDGLLIDINAGATGMTLDSVGQITITNTGVGGVYISSTSKEVMLDADQELELNSANSTIKIGNDPVVQNIEIGNSASARNIIIGNPASASVTLDAIILSLDASDDSNITLASNTGGTETLTIAVSNAGAGFNDIAVDSDGKITIDAGRGMYLNVSTGDINIGDDADAQAINIGTAGVRPITIGNATGATAVNILSGTAGINLHDGVAQLDFDGAGALSTSGITTMDLDCSGALQINSSGGVISIGNDANAFAINLGTGAAARVITIGNAMGVTAVNILSGTAGINLNDGIAQLDLDGAGALTETTLVSADITPSGALTLQGGGVSQFGDATGYFAFAGVGALSTSGITTVDLDCSGALQINSSGGTIGIGNDAVAQIITIGEITTRIEVQIDALLVDINAGVTGMTLDSAGAIAINSSAGTIGIGSVADNFGINLGTLGVRAIAIGSAAATAVNADAIAISLDASAASNFTVSGATADLTFGARAATITLNQLGETTLDASFAATSMIGAFNELKNGPIWMNGVVANAAAYTVNAGDDYAIVHVTRTATGTCSIEFKSAWIAIDYNTIFIKDTGRNSFANNITIWTEGGELFEGDAAGGLMKSDGACWGIQAYNGNLYMIT